MNAPLSAAESFLALLDDLAGTKPNGATAAVLLQHAGAHIRDLLEVVDDLRREAAHDVPRPGGSMEVPEVRPTDVPVHAVTPSTGPGHTPDLSHLPPKAQPGDGMCAAISDPDPNGGTWACNARRGHPERFHASHDPDGPPMAHRYADAAWPVAAHETGLPKWADGGIAIRASLTQRCGATEGRWECNAVPLHAPLDHVAFGAWESRMPGAVLARWPSVHPGHGPLQDGMGSSMLGQRDGRSAGRDLEADELPVPARANGHALRPPEWVCSRCDQRLPGRKPENGLCVDCDVPAEPFRLTAVDGGDPG